MQFNTGDQVKVQVFGREFEGTVEKVVAEDFEVFVNIPHVGTVVTVPEAVELV